MGFTCPGIKNWEWFHLLSGAPRYWELHEIWTWLHLCLACLPPPGHVTKLCWTCQLKVSKYWSSWNWCLFFFLYLIFCLVLLYIKTAILGQTWSLSCSISWQQWNLLTLLSRTPAVCVSGTSCARGGFCLLISPQRISRLSACSVVPWIHVKF